MTLSEQFWWYVARSSGIVAWAVLTLAVCWGLAVSTKVMGKLAQPKWLLDLHRFLGGLAVVFTLVHLAALMLDSYVHFGIVDLLVPFAADWQPGAVAWGVVAFHLLIAVEVTSLLMRRMNRKLWRGIHATSFVLWVFATVHLLTAGTDVANGALRWIAIGSIQLVAFLTMVRVVTTRRLKRALGTTAGVQNSSSSRRAAATRAGVGRTASSSTGA